MAGPVEGELAWHVVEQNRDHLSLEERHSVFVHLGVGDYPPVIHSVLSALARQQRTLDAQTVARLEAWIDSHDRDLEFGPLLAQVVGEEPAKDKSD